MSLRAAWCAAAIALAVLVASCGAKEPQLRLQAERGRALVYEAHRVDDWPDAQFGYGGVLDTTVRFRLGTEDVVAGRGAEYRVVVEAVRATGPERFGVEVDTDTPDPEPGDDRGVEALARGLLHRHGRVVLATNGLSAGVEPDREMRDRLKAWADAQPEGRSPAPVLRLLDELLDGPRVAASWIQSAALLLPEATTVAPDASWSRRTPPFGSPAGRLAADLAVTQERRDGVVELSGAGAYELVEPLPESPLAFVSGSIESRATLDTGRGVLVLYEETTTVTFRKAEGGEETTATWHRTLRLVE